jgi:hypothetical protein
VLGDWWPRALEEDYYVTTMNRYEAGSAEALPQIGTCDLHTAMYPHWKKKGGSCACCRGCIWCDPHRDCNSPSDHIVPWQTSPRSRAIRIASDKEALRSVAAMTAMGERSRRVAADNARRKLRFNLDDLDSNGCDEFDDAQEEQPEMAMGDDLSSDDRCHQRQDQANFRRR